MKVTLATSLTILIFAGSVPVLIQSSDAEGFKVCKTPKGDLFIPKDRECPKGGTESKGSTKYSGKLIIEFTEASGNPRDETFHEVRAESAISGSLDQQGRFDLSSTSGTGACSIFHPSHAHHAFAGTPKFQLIGDIRGVRFTTDLSISTSCSIPNPAGEGFPLHTLHGGYFESEGHAAAQVFCEVPNCTREWYWTLILSPTSPPNNSGCLIDTDKSDDLVGTSENDCIDGKGGNDHIAGLAGNDKLNGGDGKDLLIGGNGNDELTGGKGGDLFQCGAGNDKITDFKPSEGDKKTTDCEHF